MFFFIKNEKLLAILFAVLCCVCLPGVALSTSNSSLISLELQEVSIQEALTILAKFLHKNLVVSPIVHGTASLHLNNVPALEAFNLILLSHELSKWQIGDVWYIMPRIELMQQKQQELKLRTITNAAEPLITQIWQIHYAKAEDIAHLLQENNHALLSERGHVYIDVRTNTVCVQDVAARLHDIFQLIQRIDIPIQQVLIEVQLASVDSDYERELGIYFENQQATEADNLATTTSSPLHTQYGLTIMKLADGSLLHMQLSALERTGHGELISSPSLFTANQQTASIESGEEIPYQEISQSGATGVAFKKAVLSLKVTPQIMPGAQVLLQLQVNQDKPSSRVILGVPAITTRQIRTNILVKNGQTIVLGGIYESDNGHQQQGVPFLGKIPLVGWLFKQQNVTTSKRELLIFVTPRVMN